MAILNKKKSLYPLLFVHIPKCAGGSIKYHFHISYLNRNNFGHVPLRFYEHAFKNFNYDKYFKFTSLRNPWDRLVSLYHFRTENSHRHDGDYWSHVKNKMNFNDWIQYLEDFPKINSLYYETYFDYLSDDDEKINVDFIINFHNFKKDFKFLKFFKNENAISKMKKLNKKHIHSSQHKDFRKYYNSKTIDIVAKIHKKDIKLFKYDFDNYTYANYHKYKNYKKLEKALSFI